MTKFKEIFESKSALKKVKKDFFDKDPEIKRLKPSIKIVKDELQVKFYDMADAEDMYDDYSDWEMKFALPTTSKIVYTKDGGAYISIMGK